MAISRQKGQRCCSKLSKDYRPLNGSDLDTRSLDDLYNHLKVYEPEVKKKSESNSQNIAFISLAKNNSGKWEVNTTSISTASTHVSPASANVAATSISHDTFCAYIASQSNGSQIKYEDINQIDEDDIEEMDIKWNMALLRNTGHPGAKTGVEEKTSTKIEIKRVLESLYGFEVDEVRALNMDDNRKKIGIPTASDEFPLPDDFPTASEERFPLLSQRDAPAEEVYTADEVKD
nr:ribonuclease H-like domain-containing protein [Tanacetum cinerariifolium]